MIFRLRISASQVRLRARVWLSKLSEVQIRSNLGFIRLRFGLTVAVVGGVVFLYRDGYIERDLILLRFILLVITFVVSMLFLIFSSSWLILIIGWDGLGLSSYFLVVFYLNYSSNRGGALTVISNRVGDIFIILFIISLIREVSFYIRAYYSLIIRTLLFLAAITKRAIFPYISWLPEAIAAPTPVSRLVHSSTLVTAGVYLIFQFSGRIELIVWQGLLILSFISLIISSGVALVSQDLKKVVALSTLRQLSLIIVRLRLGLTTLAFFHLISHAIFKRCLFLAVGTLIHLRRSSQEARRIYLSGGWARYRVIRLRLMSLCARPFLAGYYSKEVILLTRGGIGGPITIVSLFTIRALFTILYSIRFVITLNNRKFYSIVNISDTNLIHLATITLIILRVSLGSWIRLNFNLESDRVKIILFSLLRFIGAGLLVLRYNTPLIINRRRVFNIVYLKSLIVNWIPNKRISRRQSLIRMGELGIIRRIIYFNFLLSLKQFSSINVYYTSSLFSKQLSILLIVLSIFIILY